MMIYNTYLRCVKQYVRTIFISVSAATLLYGCNKNSGPEIPNVQKTAEVSERGVQLKREGSLSGVEEPVNKYDDSTCVGSYEKQKCEELNLRLNEETSEQAAARRASLAEDRARNMQQVINSKSIKLDLSASNSNKSSAALLEAEALYNKKDYARAFTLFKSLAEQGSVEAKANLGLMYEHGQGVDKSFAEAFRFYREAAEQGVAWAQANLGLAYLNGRGIKQDDVEASKWLRSAALQGTTRAQEALGALYNEGRGISATQKNAAEWINPSNLMYISKLKKDYKNRIHFESENAEQIVEDFNIDCEAPQANGQYLPLINVLYARLASADNGDTWIETNIQERGGEVRISDILHKSGQILGDKVVFQINKWNELSSMGGIRVEAIRNACFNSYGPIWLLR